MPDKSWYSIEAKGKKAEVSIFDEIGLWGVTAKSFLDDVKALGSVNTITLRLNSPGGSVIDGNAIYTVLKNHKAYINVVIEGVALSMGSVIAMSGDNIEMAENSLFMIHNPHGVALGDAGELRKTADVMDKMKGSMMVAYRAKTGLEDEEISALMDDETWMDAEQAKEAGFVDEVTGAVEIAASFDLSKFSNVPKEFTSSVIDTSASAVGKTQEGKNVMPKKDEGNAADPNAVDVKALEAKATAKALETENKRQTEIRTIFAVHGDQHRDLMDTCLTDQTVDVSAASQKLLAEIGKNTAPAGADPHVTNVADEKDKYRAAAQESFDIRFGSKPNDGQNEFASYSLMDHARHCLRNLNVSTKGMDRMRIVGAAFTHSTSDFPYLLENAIGKELQTAYGNFPETWSRVAATSSVPDFKVNNRIRLGSFNSLDTIPEGLEYTHGSFSEEKETIQAATKGKMISLTRQMIINDDLGGFLRIAGMMGRAAQRTIGNDVYSVITTNAAMSDGTVLFHADHDNLAASGGAMSTTTLGAARTAMRLQQDLNSNDYLDIRPDILMVPVELEDLANQLVASETDPSNANSRVPNTVRGFAEVVSDPRLSADSTTAWYVLAAPSMAPTVEIAFLDGNQTPYLESENGFTIDGIRYKVRLDYGVDSVDFRGAYKNAGV